eukprot:TRINITY_DN4482_c0_g1_i3.p1 TRINITY_DN4482_c0_g1~~TRINITY_DN4482_c0_g1_i3.p1  ORF type:complete len:139 (-),score=33.25 TRINITY_DN4482_c0_g1_i3:503-919(-)
MLASQVSKAQVDVVGQIDSVKTAFARYLEATGQQSREILESESDQEQLAKGWYVDTALAAVIRTTEVERMDEDDADVGGPALEPQALMALLTGDTARFTAIAELRGCQPQPRTCLHKHSAKLYVASETCIIHSLGPIA